MQTEDRQVKNRTIAEWLGWKSNGGTRWHSPACQRDEENCGGKVPDFFSSEEASSLVRGKFIKYGLETNLNITYGKLHLERFDSEQMHPFDTEYETAIHPWTEDRINEVIREVWAEAAYAFITRGGA